MNVLHLFSNSKWTGPAEPALNLCVALRKRGIDAAFACAPGPSGAPNKVVETARDRGIEPVLRFRLAKHRHPLSNMLDRIALSRHLRERRYDLIHCHLDNDHRIAAAPAKTHGVSLVRSSYEGGGFKGGRARLLSTARFLIEPSAMAFERDAARFGFPRERMAVVAGAVDTRRFDPTRTVPDGRRWRGIAPDVFVVGIVARLQRHRRYEDLFGAVRRLVDAGQNVRLVVIGRGTHQAKVGKEPVQRLGLESGVDFTGYLDGEEYVGMLNAFDAMVFLMPGSDGTCRTVREGMAMAKPVVAADRGMLREIVEDGVTGFVVDGTVDSLFLALNRLAGDTHLRRRMGQAARDRAATSYSLDAQSEAVARIYESVLSLGSKGLARPEVP